jgi:hypothetical protein
MVRFAVAFVTSFAVFLSSFCVMVLAGVLVSVLLSPGESTPTPDAFQGVDFSILVLGPIYLIFAGFLGFLTFRAIWPK